MYLMFRQGWRREHVAQQQEVLAFGAREERAIRLAARADATPERIQGFAFRHYGRGLREYRALCRESPAWRARVLAIYREEYDYWLAATIHLD